MRKAVTIKAHDVSEICGPGPGFMAGKYQYHAYYSNGQMIDSHEGYDREGLSRPLRQRVYHEPEAEEIVFPVVIRRQGDSFTGEVS